MTAPTPKQFAAVVWLRNLLDANNRHHTHAQALLELLPDGLSRGPVEAAKATQHLSDEEWREFRWMEGPGYLHRQWLECKIEHALAAVTAERDDARREVEHQKWIKAQNTAALVEQLDQARQKLADAPHEDACGTDIGDRACDCWKAGL